MISACINVNGSDKFPELNRKLDEIAGRYGVSSAAIPIAWLLRHPARMQPVIGTGNIHSGLSSDFRDPTQTSPARTRYNVSVSPFCS